SPFLNLLAGLHPLAAPPGSKFYLNRESRSLKRWHRLAGTPREDVDANHNSRCSYAEVSTAVTDASIAYVRVRLADDVILICNIKYLPNLHLLIWSEETSSGFLTGPAARPSRWALRPPRRAPEFILDLCGGETYRFSSKSNGFGDRCHGGKT